MLQFLDRESIWREIGISDAGLFDHEGKVIARTEREIFEKLGMEYLEPEKR